MCMFNIHINIHNNIHIYFNIYILKYNLENVRYVFIFLNIEPRILCQILNAKTK